MPHSKLTFKVARNNNYSSQLPYEQGKYGSEHEMRSHKLLEIRFLLWPGAEKGIGTPKPLLAVDSRKCKADRSREGLVTSQVS